MDSNDGQNNLEKNKSNSNSNKDFQRKDLPRKRKKDSFEDNPKLIGETDKKFKTKKSGCLKEGEQIQVESMINDNIKDLNDFFTKNNKASKVDIPEKEKNILKCFLYIDNQKSILCDCKYLVDNIIFKVEEIDDSYIIISIAKKDKGYDRIFLDRNARIMNFIDEKQYIVYIHFIFNSIYLSEVMKEINFESYYTKPEDFKLEIKKYSSDEEEKSSDSNISTVSIENSAKIFYLNSIKNIYKYNTKPIFSKENFNKKYVEKLVQLKDLSNNAKYYFKDISQKFYHFEEYKKLCYHLHRFASYDETFVEYLYGPKCSSKSTFLIYSKNFFKDCQILSLYLDVNCLKSKDNLERKRIISHELLYLFDNIKEMETIEKQKIFHNIPFQNQNPLLYIYYFLKNLFNALKLIDNDKKIIIFIDNIIDKGNNFFQDIENIISLSSDNYKRIKFVLCGNGKYFNQKLIELYKNNSFQTNDLIKNVYILSINEQHKKLLDEFFKYSPRFNDLYKINLSKEEFEEKIINVEKKYLDIYHFSGLFFGEELINKNIKKEDIEENKNIFLEMPFEYFEIIKNNDNSLSFSFFHPIFKKIIKKKIEFEVKKGTLTRLLRDREFPRTFFGICFEKKITLLLMYNKFNLLNLFFEEKDIKEINEIADLKESNYKGPIFQIENKDNPILLLQKNFFGANYDLLILSRDSNNQMHANFVQIGVDKNQDMIDKILKDLYDNSQYYKKNIIRAFGLESELNIKITLLFIFDLDTQRKLYFTTGAKFCIDYKIDFYLFSNDSDYFWTYDIQANKCFKLDNYIPRDIDLKSLIDGINQKEESQKNKIQKINSNRDKNPKKYQFKKIEDFFNKKK